MHEWVVLGTIDEVGWVSAASLASLACRFQTSIRPNGDYTDDAEVLWPTPGEAKAVWPTPPAPPSRGGEKNAACAQQRRSFANRLLNPVNTNLAPRQGEAPAEPQWPLPARPEPRPSKSSSVALLFFRRAAPASSTACFNSGVRVMATSVGSLYREGLVSPATVFYVIPGRNSTCCDPMCG